MGWRGMSKKKKIIIKIRSKKKGEEKESRGCRMRRDVKGKKRKDQAKLPIIKIYVNVSCGLNPGTEQEGYTPGFIVTKVHLKKK